MQYELPPKDVAEVTLIGTGGGYGESCVVHYGENRWMIIDSCIDPNTGVSLSLQYLKDLKVDIENDVKIILCTHWHNDHILGLAEVFQACKSAQFCFGSAIDAKKFLQWVSLDYQKLKDHSSISSTSEFAKCIMIAKDRKTQIIRVTIDKIIERDPGTSIEIVALSPSEYVLEQFDSELSLLMSKYGSPGKKYVLQEPNDKSVVLLFSFNKHQAILGADLEVASDDRKGWLNILKDSKAIKGKSASLIKIPHHGSSTGYHERVWLELLSDKPIAKITPWKRNQSLPEAAMIKLYMQMADKLYITSPVVSGNKPKKRDKTLEKIINSFNNRLKEIKFSKGIIRSRINMNDEESKWQVELDGESFQII